MSGASRGSPSVLILGGGLSGAAAAYTLAASGWTDLTIVERGPELGGLAGTFERQGHFYPLGYHHVAPRDRNLLFFLDEIGALPAVRWRRPRMLFRLDGELYDLSAPLDLWRFPLGSLDKFRFARLMLRSLYTEDWTSWHGRGAHELIDGWASAGVREAIFEPLSRLKYDLSCAEVSGAWLGARLHYGEGSSPLGYIPGTNWTKSLCDGIHELLDRAGVKLRLETSVARLRTSGERVVDAELEGGGRIPADLFISSVPTEVYRRIVPREANRQIQDIRYTATISVICATHQHIGPEFYWMNLASLDCHAGGIFRLEALNPSIGSPGETCLNFVTHYHSRSDPRFLRSDPEIMAGYADDFRRVFGFDLEPSWVNITRLPLYSPVFVRSYQNPPIRSESWENVFFAGNYRTFPSLSSTGTALGSGIETATSILRSHGFDSELPERVRKFRLASMPRA